ncbi:MAG: alanine racemase [Myxococcaceae bacterium]
MASKAAPNRRRALDHTIRPTRAEVDLTALRENLSAARCLAGKADVLAVVKANAYGHGAVPVARALEAQGIKMLGVALVEEGLELRNAGVKAPILVLGGSYEGGYELMVAYDLVPTVFRPEHVEKLSAAAAAQGKGRVKAHLKVDTGMGRIGVAVDALAGFVEKARAYPNVHLDGLASHFASADLSDAGKAPPPPGGGSFTRGQLSLFKQALSIMRAGGASPSWRHLSNSAGVLDVPEVRDGLELNLVRPGIMLYGLSPAGWLADRATLRPVLAWKTGITHLKTVPAGTPISYGGTWVAPRESLIATLPIGYADGYNRAYSSRAPGLVRGQRVAIAGRVCRDMGMIDVTFVEGVRVGDEAVLLGAQGGERITAEELAALSGTIHYEVLCGVGARVPRVLTPDL